jgi:hypothetical protein
VRRALFRYGFGVSNVLLVGDTDTTVRLHSALKTTAHTGQKIIATVGKKIRGIPVYDSFESATAHISEPLHSVIQTELYPAQTKNNEIMRYTQQHHISYRFVPGNSDLFVGDINVELFSGVPMIAVSQTRLTGWGRIVKRVFDLSAAALILIILSPLLALIALLIKLTDPKGPVLFKQTRLTRFDTPFQVYKFRSMKRPISGITPEQAFAKMGKPHLSKPYRDNGDFLPNDPRITRYRQHSSANSVSMNCPSSSTSFAATSASSAHEHSYQKSSTATPNDTPSSVSNPA